MDFGYYSDSQLPKSIARAKFIKRGPYIGKRSQNQFSYKLNSHGYRCREFNVPDGKKNVVILGCSHTFGVGLDHNEYWVDFLSKHNTERLRYWNLGQPGASADKIVRILYGCEKVLFPNIIIVCWPEWSRRERLDLEPENLTSNNPKLKDETEETDLNNFLKNVFFVEKFAETKHCKTFHCFAQDSYHEYLKGLNVLETYTIKNCWPPWDDHNLPEARKQRITDSNVARDGIHYGEKHHLAFAELFLNKFRLKLK